MKCQNGIGNNIEPFEWNSSQNSEWHGFGVFDKVVSSWFNNVPEEHGLTEDGKTVPPYSQISVPKALHPQQLEYLIFRSFHQTLLTLA